MKDGKHFSAVERDPVTGEGYLIQYEYRTGKATDTLLSSTALKYKGTQLPVSGTFSRDEQRVLLKTDVERIYRRSTTENNFIYDLEDVSITPLSEIGRTKSTAFSPDASRVSFLTQQEFLIKTFK